MLYSTVNTIQSLKGTEKTCALLCWHRFPACVVCTVVVLNEATRAYSVFFFRWCGIISVSLLFFIGFFCYTQFAFPIYACCCVDTLTLAPDGMGGVGREKSDKFACIMSVSGVPWFACGV